MFGLRRTIGIIVSEHSLLPFFIPLVIPSEVPGMIYWSKGTKKFFNSVKAFGNCYHCSEIPFEMECDIFINT